MEPRPGLRAQTVFTVERDDTAEHVGSGDVPVLATPRLLAAAEATTLQALAGALAPEQTSVGTRVHLEHHAPSPVGMRVRVTAELTAVDGRRLVFAVTATDEHGTLVGSGTIERAVVDRVAFLARAQRRHEPDRTQPSSSPHP